MSSKTSTEKSENKEPKKMFDRSYSGPFNLNKERQRALKDWEEINKILCTNKTDHRFLKRDRANLSYFDKEYEGGGISNPVFANKSTNNFWAKLVKFLNPINWIFLLKFWMKKFKIWAMNWYAITRWHKERESKVFKLDSYRLSSEGDWDESSKLELKNKNSYLFNSVEFLNKRHEGRISNISNGTVKIFEKLRRESIKNLDRSSQIRDHLKSYSTRYSSVNDHKHDERINCSHVLCKLYLGKDAPCYGRAVRSTAAARKEAASRTISNENTCGNLSAFDFASYEKNNRPGLFRHGKSKGQMSYFQNNFFCLFLV